MRIGIDVRDLKSATTGQLTYLQEIVQAFQALQQKDKHLRITLIDTILPVYTGEVKFLKIIEHARYQVWKQLILPFKAWWHRCDILFCTDYFVPLIRPGFKTAVVFHDAFFFESPQHYNRIWGKFFRKVAIPAARKADWIIVPTDYARDRIIAYTGFNPSRVIRVYEGPKSMGAEKREVSPFLISTAPYILHVGIMNKRKNLPFLIRAFARFRDQGHSEFKLVLAGIPVAKKHIRDDRGISDTIAALQLTDHVIFPGYVPNEILAALYLNAFMYVFPSLNEGFGIPVLEAFKYGLPVLVADNSCLPEVGGDAVLCFDPSNEDQLAKLMMKIAEDHTLRQDMIAKGRLRLTEFTWEKAADQLLELFEKSMTQVSAALRD